jgi:glycosyltransferase involved in cell wall biosynthesis
MYKIGDIRNGYEVLPKEERKTILLLSDDMRMTSGVGNMSREFVIQTIHRFNWVQIGGAINHPDNGKNVDMNEDISKRTGVPDCNVKVHPVNGYGDQMLVRGLMSHYNIDGLMIYTDPRFWEWLFQMERELRQTIPIMYYNIWDDLPYPMWNQKYYDSVDSLFNISKQTVNIVNNVKSEVEPWQSTYIPHGINEEDYYPIDESYEKYDEFLKFKSGVTREGKKKFVVFYNARNIRRKLPGDIIYSYKTFCDQLTKEEASECLLLMHCSPRDNNGTDLPDVVRNLCPEYDVAFSDAKYEREQMNWLYNSANASILISSNEGFGLMGAETLMCGTPLIVNVSGGMQDYCGFIKEDGTHLTHEDYTTEWGSNHDGRYKDHGEWVFPVWPACRSLQGSVPTPYISDDRPDFQDVAIQLLTAYKMGPKELKRRGLEGHKYVMNPEFGFTASEMGKRFIHDIDATLENYKPRSRFELSNVITYEKKVPKFNGLTLSKEIIANV